MRYLLLSVMLTLCCVTATAQSLYAVAETAGGEQSVWSFTRVPIANRGASTFYVRGHIAGLGEASLLVDTGSGYSAMDADSVAVLRDLGIASYVKQLRGVMADGSKKIMPVYRIPGISLGDSCFVGDIEVAVFPNKTRMILGLNALRKLAPFAFSLDERRPELMLSNCQQQPHIDRVVARSSAG